MRFLVDLAELQCRSAPATGSAPIPYPGAGQSVATKVEVSSGAELAGVLRRIGLTSQWSGQVVLRPPPPPAGPVPIPYPTTGAAKRMEDELHRAGYRNVRLTEAASRMVEIGGKAIAASPASTFAKSTGDEAGTAAAKGLVMSGKVRPRGAR